MFPRSGDVMRRARVSAGSVGGAMARAVGSSMRGGDGKAPWAVKEDAGGRGGGVGGGGANAGRFGPGVSARFGQGGLGGGRGSGGPISPPSLTSKAWNKFPLIRVQDGGRNMVVLTFRCAPSSMRSALAFCGRHVDVSVKVIGEEGGATGDAKCEAKGEEKGETKGGAERGGGEDDFGEEEPATKRSVTSVEMSRPYTPFIPPGSRDRFCLLVKTYPQGNVSSALYGLGDGGGGDNVAVAMRCVHGELSHWLTC